MFKRWCKATLLTWGLMLCGCIGAYASDLQIEVGIKDPVVELFAGEPPVAGKTTVMGKVQNVSKKDMVLSEWTCSTLWDWKIDNKAITLEPQSCRSNFQQSVTLKPGEIHEVPIPLVISADVVPGKLQFRLGYLARKAIVDPKTTPHHLESPPVNPDPLWSKGVALTIKKSSIRKISAADAEQLVQKWLASQNQGDYQSYEQLYADRFTGIRRSGDRTVPMNRSRWMVDRRKMFAKPMKVEAVELSIIPGNASAIVTFVQSWESKTYKDKGRKQLVLVRDSQGQLKIGQEEMLESKIALQSPAPPSDQLDFAFMLGGYIVLPGQPADNGAEGVPSLISLSPALAVADARVSGLPDYAKKWKGKPVRVYDKSGRLCSGTLNKIVIIAAVIPHFGKVQSWEGQIPGEQESSAKLPDPEIAKDIWQEGDKYLAAQFDPQDSGCSEGQWAQSASMPTPRVIQKLPVDSKLRQEILTQFHATKDFKAAGSGAEMKDASVLWDSAEGSETEVQMFSFPKGDYVTVATQSGDPCSDGFFAALSAVGKLTKSSPQTTVQWLGSYEQFLNFNQAIESEAGGSPWIMFESFPAKSGVLGVRNGKIQTIQELTIPYHDCPC